jgi:hypothetical protein
MVFEFGCGWGQEEPTEEGMMDRNEAERFAAEWAEAWNERDIERVLAHFDDNVTFTSPTAQAVVGVPTVRGKEALRAYWVAALERIQSLRFTVNRVLWDPKLNELAIIYSSVTDGNTKQVSENLRFGLNGLVVSAEVFHGVFAQHL